MLNSNREEAIRRINAWRSGTLDLSSLGLVEVPAELFQTKKFFGSLTWLRLHGNQLSTLPESLGELSSLTSLDLDDNQLSTLPESLGELSSLITLHLHGNQLSTLPESLGQLSSLRLLRLGSNQLSTLPESLGELSSLTSLDLDDNQLSTLPESLGELSSLTELRLDGNQLDIPDAVLRSNPSDILEFYFSNREKQGPIGEVKVMLVGRGGAGKTSLRRYFTEKNHREKEPETQGISIDTFEMKVEERAILVRLWDFAGQEITHALHKFFLSEGCVYILLVEPRADAEMEDAKYWLNLLETYCPNSKVLVAINKQDLRENGGYDLDRHSLLEDFPEIHIHSFTRTSCSKREGCDELKNHLIDAIDSLDKHEPPHLAVSSLWFSVINRCKAAGQNQPHMEFDDFREICIENGETASEKHEFMARVLNKLGVILHFADEPKLRDTAVLSPHWVTDGVYRLLRHKDAHDSDGMLTLDEAKEALRQKPPSDEDSPSGFQIDPTPNQEEKDARYLMRLMERFEMCFSVEAEPDAQAAKPDVWLVPGAMAKFQPASISVEWETTECTRIKYVYDELPEGLLPRFIVRTQLLSDGQIRWRQGVVLKDLGAQALVRRRNARREDYVEVTVKGEGEDRFRLLQIIQQNLERIHEDLPGDTPGCFLEISDGIFKDINDLKAHEKLGSSVPLNSDSGVVEIDAVKELNRISFPESRDEKRTPLKAFLSYAHDDFRRKERFKNNLSVMNKKKLIDTWEDGRIESGSKWLEQIQKRLGEMDVFIGLLTTAFLASDFIEKVELKAAREKLKKQGHDFGFYLIVVHDISIEGLDLNEYQLIYPGGKAVEKHSSYRAGFDCAQKELEQVLGSLLQKKQLKTDALILGRPPKGSGRKRRS